MTPHEQEAFRTYCVLQGFDLPAFDAWLSTMEGHGVHKELSERRALTWAAAQVNNLDAALRHLEWMLRRWREIRRGEKRSKQLSDFAVKGNEARRKYTEADRAKWCEMVASDPDLQRLAKSSKRACATKVAERLNLPPEAAETIRKAL